MLPQRLTKDTVYKQYVYERVGQVLSERWGAYDYIGLATLVGLKPTHNFRRRVREMVQAGLIKSVTAFTPRGGLTILFHHPTVEPTEIPF